ncbi:CGNR zinc finger domain-containing protein [Microbacterium resistens]
MVFPPGIPFPRGSPVRCGEPPLARRTTDHADRWCGYVRAKRRRPSGAAGPDCGGLFGDGRRGRNHRWCPMTICGSRGKKARLSARGDATLDAWPFTSPETPPPTTCSRTTRSRCWWACSWISRCPWRPRSQGR